MTIRTVAFLKRRPDITHEQFIERWGQNHAKIFTSLEVTKRNIIRYSQLHVNLQHSKTLNQAGLQVASFDGMVEMEVENLDDFLAIFTDEEFLKIGSPDEDNFLDKTSVQVIVGEAFVKFDRARDV
ncbi:hypothetical protein M422DRAFT_39056 [Sphaerobolus stellatus SS14]|uniref:EthD domain-containing protein n=1 Tax=Sphaerobolus stellatus (strain SS14) TaxID=990650 RepID=A0A0C9UHI6_SPHS4|nr:hypothetical protein M422DRAFT_39056 [Sphaerobolus stellatus SS14]